MGRWKEEIEDKKEGDEDEKEEIEDKKEGDEDEDEVVVVMMMWRKMSSSRGGCRCRRRTLTRM
eukprot:477889-Hanusia_phi.AAC.1